MKSKIFLVVAILAFCFAGLYRIAQATMGSATLTTLSNASPTQDQKFSLGNATGPTPTNTPQTDTSSAINSVGFGTTRFVIAKTGYWGAFKIQGSMDNSSYVTLLQDDTGEAVTETVYWECSEPFKYYKVVTLPSVNDTGTVAVSGAQLVKSTGHTGYYGPHVRSQEILASALRTATTNTYFHVEAPGGLVVRINATASNSGSLVGQLYRVSPGGVKTAVGAALTAITGAKTYTIFVSNKLAYNPALATATPQPFNQLIYSETGAYWDFVCTESGTSTTYSVDVTPIQ